jgi:hypothetical protein
MLNAKLLRKYSNAPSENGIVWVWHVDHIKSDVLCARVLGGAKGHRECNSSNWLNSIPTEAIEGL